MPYAIEDPLHRPILWREHTPTAEQNDRLELLKSWITFHQPFFGYILFRKIKVKLSFDVPIAATDGFSVVFNPTTFLVMTVREMGFVCCHEILHCIFEDPRLMNHFKRRGNIPFKGRQMKYDTNQVNCSMDYIINGQLKAGMIGDMPAKGLYDANISKEGQENWLDIYELVGREMKNQQGKSFDVLLDPPVDDTGKVEERDEYDWQETIKVAAKVAEAQGKLPGSMKRWIGEITEPKVAWNEHLRAAVMRVNGNDGIDWSQADRRMMSRSMVGQDNVFFGRPTGFGCGTVVVAVDSSGSTLQYIAPMFTEIVGIMNDLNPRMLVVMFCDAHVHDLHELEEVDELEDIRTKELGGGGGTSFVPVFDKVEELGYEPDMLIYLTDLAGRFPKTIPDYPVIWGSINQNSGPFGETVHIEL